MLAGIPQAVAFTIIAGVDPKVGLYASCSLAMVVADQARLAARRPETAPTAAADGARKGRGTENDPRVFPHPDEANRL